MASFCTQVSRFEGLRLEVRGSKTHTYHETLDTTYKVGIDCFKDLNFEQSANMTSLDRSGTDTDKNSFQTGFDST